MDLSNYLSWNVTGNNDRKEVRSELDGSKSARSQEKDGAVDGFLTE